MRGSCKPTAPTLAGNRESDLCPSFVQQCPVSSAPNTRVYFCPPSCCQHSYVHTGTMALQPIPHKTRFNNFLLRIKGCQDRNICERCSAVFNSGSLAEKEGPRANGGSRTHRQPFGFDCIGRLRGKETCPLCRAVLLRLDHISACRCMSASDFCITLEDSPKGRGHDFEWYVNYLGVRRGSVVRNSRVKLRNEKIEPVWIFTHGVPSCFYAQGDILGYSFELMSLYSVYRV
jgi:hypothetical protein